MTSSTTPHRRLARLVAFVLAAFALVTGVALAAQKTSNTRTAAASRAGHTTSARTTSTRTIGTGVVVIDTALDYQQATAAGTGMVLTSNGEILTNNHVISGATSIVVVVPGTTHRYKASVVGYDRTDDVAVLKLAGAANLKTVTLAKNATVRLGAAVTAVGNAGGTGRLVSVTGTVTGIAKSIVASDDSGNTERLTNLVETNAPIQPGDSGGPLVNAAKQVVGMDTAASASSPFASDTGDGYAIRIAKAVRIAAQIEAGKASATIHVGATAFLGIEVTAVQQGYDSAASAGAAVAAVVPGGPAAKAGLAAGDVITRIGGTTIAAPNQIAAVVLRLKPGAKVTLTYVDASGTTRTTTVTLGSGLAQ